MNSEQFRKDFIEETIELLGSLESRLLEMEESPDDIEKISAVFRIIHTIKGASYMFGFNDVSSFVHEVENIFDAVRCRKLKVSRELINWTLKSGDHIIDLIKIDNSPADRSEILLRSSEIIKDFLKAVGMSEVSADEEKRREEKRREEKNRETVTSETVPFEKDPGEDGIERLWRIQFRPNEDVFLNGTEPLLLIEELSGFGESMMISNNGSTQDRECPCWDILLLTGREENEIRDVFIFVENDSELLIDEVTRDELASADPETPLFGKFYLDRGDISGESLRRLLEKEDNTDSADNVNTALEENNFIKSSSGSKSGSEDPAVLRVSSDKLDELLNLTGELVKLHSEIELEVSDDDKELYEKVEALGRISENLRENAMGMRLVSVYERLIKFKRIVRDLSNNMGKKVELVIAGEKIEIDKTVIEKLRDPFIHIIINAIDHGIEIPSERKKKGKPETGTIRLKIEQAGASVRIIVEDDGSGLSKQKIFDKALQSGIIKDDTELTEDELYMLIFVPGFSTAENTTSISGRGVGMDVVKEHIEVLNGNVKVESVENEFTRIILSIPLTEGVIKSER